MSAIAMCTERLARVALQMRAPLIGLSMLVAMWPAAQAAETKASSGPPPNNYQRRAIPDLSRVFETKIEAMVAMRDGVKLHTEVYIPKGHREALPIILERTAYYANPKEAEFSTRLALYSEFFEEGFIFALQDTRGRYLSEGKHMFVRAQRKPGDKNGTDESTDYYDTIDWLVKNVRNNNGRVGTLGISYGGFLTTRAMLGPHPALKAVSPQAACADMFMGDDFFHNGAFRLNYAISVAASLEGKSILRLLGKRDEYEAYLSLGPLSNVDRQYFKGEAKLWNQFVGHPVLDDTWRYEVCGVLPHMVEPTVPALHVLGWYDMEDFYGPLEVYKQLERKDRDKRNYLVIGPWHHGGWTFEETGRTLGPLDLGADTAAEFRRNVHLRWFTYWLKRKGKLDFPEVAAFQMGSNEWQYFDKWPPPSGIEGRELYLQPSGKLSFDAPPAAAASSPDAFDSYVSDPAKPVPYRHQPSRYPYGWETWFLEDQRFAASRPDVLTWVSEPLQEALSITGDPRVHLFAATSGTDADWVVKLIDVFPEDFDQWELSGYQPIVGAEVFRARFRTSFEKPQPVPADRVQEYTFGLRDRNHRFLPGHRIMVQIQSSWFPVIDRNPQTYVPNIFKAEAGDFRPATQRIYRSAEYPSHITLPVSASTAKK